MITPQHIDTSKALDEFTIRIGVLRVPPAHRIKWWRQVRRDSNKKLPKHKRG